MKVRISSRGQAIPERTEVFGPEAFAPVEKTEVRWLGGAGALINSRGTKIMIDPVLSGFDMPLLIDIPISESQVPGLDGVLLTHCDNDHYGRRTCRELACKTRGFYSTKYVTGLLEEELGISGQGFDIGEHFAVGEVNILLTPVWHNWQNEAGEQVQRKFLREDGCGFWLDTPDGSIWAIGDSRLLEEQLHMPTPDAILFDFSDSSWHIGQEGALRLALAYPDTPLLLWHWGSVDAPDWKEFNGNPQAFCELVHNPGRVVVLNPGQVYELRRLH